MLESQSISAIADVRSYPYSQYCPQFNKGDIEHFLKNNGIEYMFLGKELGARSDDDSCYIEGQAKYDLISESPAFQSGLEYIFQKIEQYRLALMCSEAEPLNCHRTILICRQLKKNNPNFDSVSAVFLCK